ncbi:3-oxoacyl-[acyl-carrier-protein] reductase FabG [Aquisphaera giovannonii]|uniref:3-oxoacyl-[acyl-carrier-protein] reductase FabG n=1 Tax=Aquisphaera giovannonii TaxID=406548 RepID=A0A5B9W4Z6_9BACT|nr:SDR family oxidoreductase [Aquisphaera giovannonii]QEH35672.1 3-oxoacyl-[acyl-carrier-protein] reductase FabG [Aquisphaera giovannonii]
MDLGLSGQVAAVFGAGRGIGEAIAAAFAAEGASLVAIDRDPRVAEVAGRLPATGDGARALGIVADVTDHAAVRRAADSVRDHFGRCEHVVFAVAIGSGKFGFPFWNLEPEDWDRVLRVNLVGAVAVAQAFAPLLVESKDGSMLFLASVAGQIGSQTDPPYSASKAGLINFTQCAAKDLAAHGVRVNALCPGMVQTPLNRSTWDAWNRRQPEESRQAYEEWAAAKIKQLVPLNRWQQPEDIAAMAVFLAGRQGRNITGQTVNVDGGYVMHW